MGCLSNRSYSRSGPYETRGSITEELQPLNDDVRLADLLACLSLVPNFGLGLSPFVDGLELQEAQLSFSLPGVPRAPTRH